MVDLVGREAEIAILDDIWERSNPSFVAVYGRRRVGKTYLIHHYFSQKGIYFELTGSKKASKLEQLKNFHREFSRTFPHLSQSAPPKDWGEAFECLVGAFEQIQTKQKFIVFLDELPWLASPRSGFLPALEYAWNRHFSHLNNVILIICGSAASWMIKKIVNNKEGFYGRLTRVIQLLPFSLGEGELFLRSKDIHLERKQVTELFMATGGIGAYLAHSKPGMSVVQMINDNCFKPNGPLFLEFNNLFQSLFNHSEKHINIVRALAAKRRGLNQSELLKVAKLHSSGRFAEVLEELESCGFIMSLPQFGKKTKEKRYRLTDEYSYFYLSWIEPEYQAVLQGTDDNIWQKIFASPRWLSWAGYTFETICLKHIKKIKQALGISGIKTQQTHWQYSVTQKHNSDFGAEIDLVIDRSDNCINLCEIKFCDGEFTIDKSYAEKLRKKLEVFREKTKTRKSLFITMITPFGVHENGYSRELVQSEVVLDDLF